MTSIDSSIVSARAIVLIQGLGIALLLPLASCGDAADGSGGSGGSGTEATSSTSAGSGGAGTGGAGSGCTQAREDALGPMDTVSTGQVVVLEQTDGVATLFIDASAGGSRNQASNPWIYIDLGTLAPVAVTDLSADTSTDWDLAIKRPVLRTNSGDGGLAGQGGALRLSKPFDEVTGADASGMFEAELWFDADCNLQTDPTGAIATSFENWYTYENMVVTPAPDTWLVRGGDGGAVYKLEILDYYANPDGSHGMAGGRYTVRVAEITP